MEAELNAALAAAQGEFPPITKSKEVKTGSYSYTYAPLEVILDQCRPVLAKHGLAITQLLEQGENGTPGIRTELRHKGGGVIGASFPLPSLPQKAQELGSLLTYLRRYAIVALLGIAAEDDDDGAQAQTATQTTPRRRTQKPEKKPPPPLEPSQEQKDAFYKPTLMDADQLKRLMAAFTQKGITDREKRLAFCTQALGREITSSKEIEYREAPALIKQVDAYNPEDPQTYPFPAGY